MAKSKERLAARELRRKGESIGSIARKVGVSKSSVSLWCRDIELTKEQKEKLIEDDRVGGEKGRLMAAESKTRERLGRVEKFMRLGRRQMGDISKRDLLIMGIALYWAEGSKKDRKLTFTNSDPAMIRIWMIWLKECLGICTEDITCNVGINEIHKDRVVQVEEYWSRITGVPVGDFRKVSLKRVKSSKVYEKPEEYFGTLNVKVRKSTNMNYLMLGLIAGLSHNEAKGW